MHGLRCRKCVKDEEGSSLDLYPNCFGLWSGEPSCVVVQESSVMGHREICIIVTFFIVVLQLIAITVENQENGKGLEGPMVNLLSNTTTSYWNNPNAGFSKYKSVLGVKESGNGSKFPLLPTILCGLVLTLTLTSWWELTGSAFARRVNKFPGPPVFPLIGTAYMFLGPPKYFLPRISRYVQKYGPRWRLWKLGSPYIVLVDAKDAEVFLSSSQLINKSSDYAQLHWMNGDGLITSGGDVWREDRRLLNPSFKYQRYDGFLDSFNKHGRILVRILQSLFPQGEEVLDIHPTLCRCTMDTVFEGVLGTSFSIQESSMKDDSDDIGSSLYKEAKAVMKSYRLRTMTPWLCLPIVRNLLGIKKMEESAKGRYTSVMSEVIQKRRELLARTNSEEDSEGSKPFIDTLLNSRSNQNLVDHAFTIFAAGFETNATAMNFLLFLLALNPECQRKVHEELDRVFPDESKLHNPTLKNLAELKYLEMCILEGMRIFPPAPLLGRTVDFDVTLDDGQVVPKGSNVIVFVYELHNDPKVYPSPRSFNPERFSPDEISARHPYAYVPFSKGPRSCIGQRYAMLQMKAVLSHVLREFTVSTQTKMEDVHIVYGTIIEINTNIYLTLTPRK